MSDFWIGAGGAFLGASLAVLATEIVKFFREPGHTLEDRRNEILRDMRNRIDTVDQTSTAYWNGQFPTSSNEILTAEQNIKSDLHCLIGDANELFGSDDKAKAICEGSIRSFRILITGGDFGDGQELSSRSRALDIRKSAGDLKRLLRIERDKLRRRFF
jgi:hypothetical protein